jgi:hypothetical protein
MVTSAALPRHEPAQCSSGTRHGSTNGTAPATALRHGEQFRYIIEHVELTPDLTKATVTVCSADGSQLVQPGAGPGGADVIIDGAYTSGRAAWDMRLDSDGAWRPYDAPAIGATESRDVCPAS